MHKVYPDYSTPHPLFHLPLHKSLYSIHNLLCCLTRDPLSLTRIIYVTRDLGIFSGAWGLLSGMQLKTPTSLQNLTVSNSLPETGLVSSRRGMWERGQRGRFSHTLVASGHFELLHTRAEKGDLASALPWFTVFSFIFTHFLYLHMGWNWGNMWVIYFLCAFTNKACRKIRVCS